MGHLSFGLVYRRDTCGTTKRSGNILPPRAELALPIAHAQFHLWFFPLHVMVVPTMFPVLRTSAPLVVAATD